MSRFFIVLLTLIPLSLSALCPFVYPGCLDPTALNYDPEATIDNGTCIYSTGPDLMGVELNIIQQWCNTFEQETYSFEFTVTNIGTEDVEYFCINDFLGAGFNCFDGLINGSVLVSPGDTITVGGSFQIMGGWLDSQMNFMTITSIPGEIVTGNNIYSFSMEEELDCSTPPPNECDTIIQYVNIIDTLLIDVLVYLTDTMYVELPSDTITVTQIDTVITQEYVYLTDTLIEYITDTVIVDNYIYTTDTLEIEVLEYVFLTDTITETIEIDCNTNLPCNDLIIDECWPWSIFIPNVFTPNNDGINDVWQIILDLDCWVDVEFKIYNRWGGLVFEGYGIDYNSYPYWDGSMQGGPSYVADGIYVYTFYARKHNSPEIYQRSGHLTILR